MQTEILKTKSLEHILAGETDYFYKTRQWKAKRIEVLERDHYECQRCLMKYKPGIEPRVKHPRITKAVMVHHNVPLKDDAGKALQDDNLVSLCFRCHEIVEGRYGIIKHEKPKLTEEKW